MTNQASLKIDGTCLCGHVQYEAVIDPSIVRICHCTQCQIHSSSAFRFGVMVPHTQFRLIRGDMKTYIKTAESGAQRALLFCPECGTSIYGTTVIDPQMYSLRLGTARQRADIMPAIQMWTRSELPWVSCLDQIPRTPTSIAAMNAAQAAAQEKA
jgi:hypothetical protein